MKKPYILLFLGLTLLQACERDFNNPFDPDVMDTVEPKASILTGPKNNEEVTASVVQFTWKGNLQNSTFRYKLVDFHEDWSDWLNTTQVRFNGLADMPYTFLLQERYPTNEVQKDTTSVSFVVNAIDGPALLFQASQIEVQNGALFTIKLMADELEDVVLVMATLSFNTDMLSLQSVSNSNGDMTKDADAITFVSTPTSEANANGQVEVVMGRFGDTTEGFTGNASLFELIFLAKDTGNTTLEFLTTNNQTAVKNSKNQTVLMNNFYPINITIN